MNYKVLELLDKRKIKKIVYFHVDHFEPFTGPGRVNNLDGIRTFIRTTKKYKHSEKQSLFIPIPFIRTIDKRDGISFSSEKDDIYFSMNDKVFENVTTAIKLLYDSGYDINVHIHHEHWTNNGTVNKKSSNDKLANIVRKKDDKADSIRFETVLDRSLDIFSDALSFDFRDSEWSFVHGCWALNGSDSDICNIKNEIIILKRNGCVADFSFPAGRGHCNPTLEEPFSVKPINKMRSYDDDLSNPDTTFPRDKFIIWNSKIKHGNSSLDYYSESIKKRISDPNAIVHNWIKSSNVINNTLFIKTHAHSMDLRYWVNYSAPILPTTHPNIVKSFSILKSICESKNIEIETKGVRDIINILRRK